MNKLIIFLFLLMGLVSCGSEDDRHRVAEQVVTVTERKMNSHYFYTGVLQPIKTVVITSPADGVVENLMFHYGDEVGANQLLFTLFSDKFRTDYKNALMQYIKAKTEFNQHRSQLTEAEFLFKNELISKDEFKSKQTTFYTSQLTLVQSEDSLSEMFKQLDIKGFNLNSLSIEDIDKITQILHAKDGSQTLHISSPTNGVALLPVKNDNSEVKKLSKGEAVKQGDVLTTIGDMSGLLIPIQVNEFDVNQLKVGQAVRVTGTAFPQYVLQGKIAAIDKQAQAGQGGVPIFPVEVVVPVLTREQQSMIHIGMSAKVEIIVESEPVISVPVGAVMDANGSPYVRVRDHQRTRRVPVRPGKTTPTDVVIEAKLNTGEQLVVTG